MDINSLSPSIREALLNRNIISDTVTENGLSGLLYSISNFTSIGDATQSVQASPNIEEIGELYQDLLIINNKYQGSLDDRMQISIIDVNNNVDSNGPKYSVNSANLLENSELHNDLNIINNKYKNSLGTNQVIDIKTYQPLDPNTIPQPYSQDTADANLPQSDEYRKNLTTKSKYLDADAQILKDIITSPVVTDKNFSNYLEETNGIAGGGVTRTASNVIDNFLGGTLPPTNQIGEPNPVFEIQGLLSSRNIDANETPLGLIGANQLAFAIQANAGANLYQSTLGNINTNPLSVLMGNDIIVPNYTITVAKGDGGTALNYAEKILGFEAPVSLLANSSSIFQSENPVPNVQRGNSQIENSGRGQVLSLFANLQASLLSSNAVKSGYAPGFVDPKDPNGGINPNIYAFSDNEGGVIDLLHGPDNNPISQSNYQLEDMVRNSGFRGLEGLNSTLDSQPDARGVGFAWNDPKQPITTRNANFDKKTLLAKTQALFDNSSKMINLMTTKYTEQLKSEVNSSVVDTIGGSYMSKGSAVRKFNGQDIETDPENMFARTWTTFERYDRVDRLQRHSGLDPNAGVNKRGNLVGSVLDDNGFVRIAPVEGDDADFGSQVDTKIRNFMFSIENLAWADDLTKLIPSEVGPGDITNGKRGRIMWFPPYEMNFVDNTNVNWEKTEFIGRGEPIYTYNNTERTGNLQFKIIIDHPAYMNSLKGETDDVFNSFFAGAKDLDPRVKGNLSPDELNTIELYKNKVIDEVNNTPQTPPANFSVYFPFDKADSVTDLINSGYENGLDNGGNPIDYMSEPTGEGYGLIDYISDAGVTINDNTNFGYNDALTTSLEAELQQALRQDCPACKVTLTVYGNNLETSDMKNARIQSVFSWFNDVILDPNDPIKNKRIKSGGDGGSLGPTLVAAIPSNFPQDPNVLENDGPKSGRKVTVQFEWDAKLAEELNPNKKTPVTDEDEIQFTDRLKARFYNEIGFFQKLRQDDKFVYDSLSEKIGFFHPAFHAITPEGFNSRLTFLQQCTRQGPTHYVGDTNEASETPDNLAFGRPPVCILRIGDFYHTKIVIDTVNFSYEPLVWDLNPEGVGVQPMICTVDLNFAFIGGSSLQGPINRLQNAISFNFFANSQIYDPRADSIKVSNEPEYRLVDGEFPETKFPPTPQTGNQAGLNGNKTPTPTNQQATASQQTGGSGAGGAGNTPPPTAASAKTDFERIMVNNPRLIDNQLQFSIGRRDSQDTTALSQTYEVKVSVTSSSDTNRKINYVTFDEISDVNLVTSYSLSVAEVVYPTVLPYQANDKILTVELVGTSDKFTVNLQR